MDLAQKSNRAKRDLAAAVSKPEATSLRHAVESFDAFVDAVVDEIEALKAANKKAAAGTSDSAGDAGTTTSDSGGSMNFASGDAGSTDVDTASTPTPAS